MVLQNECWKQHDQYLHVNIELECQALSDVHVHTNHSIRATSIRVMDEAGFEARHIMQVTGQRYDYYYPVLL